MFRPLLSSVALILLSVSTLPAQEWARNLLATTEHNFGSVARGAKAEYLFVITNNLQDDVHIAAVRSSCGCTTPSIANDKRTLKTYETGAILAHLNSDTHVGQRAATLTVTFDQPQYAEVQLQIRALVHTDVLMEPTSLQFGTVDQGKPAEAQVRLYRADYPNWQVQDVRLSDPNLQGEAVLEPTGAILVGLPRPELPLILLGLLLRLLGVHVRVARMGARGQTNKHDNGCDELGLAALGDQQHRSPVPFC